MLKVFVACLLALSFALPSAQAHTRIIIGVEPAMYETVVAGVKGWNEAGMDFVVRPTGCGTGEVTFCYSEPPWHLGADTGWIAWYIVGGNTIYVSTMSDYEFTDKTVCHELGHWLGLHYHRSDDKSCMTSPAGTVAYPDEIDLENLGMVS